MKSDIIVIGAGASGLLAAYGAARQAVNLGMAVQVTILERMPRPGRKIMITGKGRCNFTNLKDWNEFSVHIRSKSNFVKSAFYNLTSQDMIDLLESYGLPTVVERGDRAFPESYHASDVVDTLVSACLSVGVKIETECDVLGIRCPSSLHGNNYSSFPAPTGNPERTMLRMPDQVGHDERSIIAKQFEVTLSDGRVWCCKRLIIATGGLSYPTTGCTGDGYKWALESGHSIVPCFPSLTALVPSQYKDSEGVISRAPKHIDRTSPLSDYGRALCGLQLKNVGVTLLVQGLEVESEFGDIDFTDGGIEGPIGFQLSRRAVKSLINGSKVSLALDLKPGVSLPEVTTRVKELWAEIDRDPRSRGLHEKQRCAVLLGKLMPRDLISAFVQAHPEVYTLQRRSRTETKVWVNLINIAKALKSWTFEIVGYVGYERCVVTAGGVSTDDLISKTMESRRVPGLYFCGEVVDIDSDTGGYNLQTAFSTGMLAGQSAAKSL